MPQSISGLTTSRLKCVVLDQIKLIHVPETYAEVSPTSFLNYLLFHTTG